MFKVALFELVEVEVNRGRRRGFEVAILRGADLMKRDQGASGLPLAVVALPGEKVENLNAVKRLVHEHR